MSRGKVTIIREYETNQDDNSYRHDEPNIRTTITRTHETKTDETPLKINVIRERSGASGGGGRGVVPAQKGGPPPASFTEMQTKMEDEMERRRLDWEKDVSPCSLFIAIFCPLLAFIGSYMYRCEANQLTTHFILYLQKVQQSIGQKSSYVNNKEANAHKS